MSPRRLVMLVRLSVYGVVLLLAVGVYFLRAGQDTSAHFVSPGKWMRGRTTQGLDNVFALERSGHVNSIEMWWNLRCTNGATWKDSLEDSWRDPVDHFTRDGRSFALKDSWDDDPTDGLIPHVAVWVSGTLAPNGRSAAGQGAAVIQLKREPEGTVGATCLSGTVGWRTVRG
jgi:hypothetical protein